ncbi:MAG TPA: BrnT family toxin [Rhodothermia bacterium]|nr:BrnT family toxin [Rhodothermia bacterium]
MSLVFEWDSVKAWQNKAKHGVTFEEAQTVFRDPLGGIIDDPLHSMDEQRLLLIGMSDRQRLITVMFTEKGDRIRLISARLVTRAERRNYEETSR